MIRTAICYLLISEQLVFPGFYSLGEVLPRDGSNCYIRNHLYHLSSHHFFFITGTDSQNLTENSHI